MDDKYVSLISGLVGAIIGASASLLTVGIQFRHWLTQQRWNNRERHYMDLLSNLNRLKLSLEDRDDYYAQPGSEHIASLSEGEHFQLLSRIGYEALKAVREQVGPASVFLSPKAIAALEKLVTENWHASEGSVCTADYIRSTLPLAAAAYSAVLEEAKQELAAK